MVAARRTYIDMFLKLTDKYKKDQLYFYDINAKIAHKFSEKDKLSVSVFQGKDQASVEDYLNSGWSNRTIDIKEVHSFKSNTYLKSSIAFSDYLFSEYINSEAYKTGYKTGVGQATLKEVLSIAKKNHEITTGFQASFHNVLTGQWYTNDYQDKERRKAIENALFFNDIYTLSENLNANIGLRAVLYSFLGSGNNYQIDETTGNILSTEYLENGKIGRSYFNLEPRLSLNWNFKKYQSLKIGYSRTSQNIHSVLNPGPDSQGNRFGLSTENIKPEITDQASLGYFYSSLKSGYDFSAETYYKETQNVCDFRQGYTMFDYIELERLVVSGQGRSYGIELSFRKNIGKLTAVVSYTLSKSEIKIEGNNNNNWYNAYNDHTHDLSLLGMWQLGKKWSFTASWVFNTGRSFSMPAAKYEFDSDTRYYFSEQNSYRFPAYHRLDIGFVKQLGHSKNFKQELSFGCYNAYNRHNAYMITIDEDAKGTQGPKTVKISLFGSVPYVSWTIKF